MAQVLLLQMLEQYGVDSDVTAMVDAFDWYILPVFNVDGYEYTWTDVSIHCLPNFTTAIIKL